MKISVSLVAALALSLLSLHAADPVKLGNEVLVKSKFKVLAGKKVGLITNPSGINRRLEHIADILKAAPEVQLTALYAPEHGIYGDIYAGDHFDNRTDPRTGLPVYSIYGKTRKPTAEMVKGLDVMVYDLQDIGCRSYTYISSMGLAMETCAQNGIEFVVLDRPNPLGGERIEGPMLQEAQKSFISQWKIPYVYGLTSGELAQMINGEGWIKAKCKLTVVPMEGWKRDMVWTDTGLPWVPTSPHVPHGESPMYYVATGVLGELYSVNIGVGYTLPFQCIAVPGADMFKLAEELNDYGLPGVRFKPVTYKPFYYTYKEELTSGAQVYIMDPVRAPLMAINIIAYEAIKKHTGRDLFEESIKVKRKTDMFDKACGTDKVRIALMDGVPAEKIIQSWKADEDKFRQDREKYLIYK